MRVISLGWGVQSFTLAAMAALGEIEKVDYAINADTGYESILTYEFAARWGGWLSDHGVKVITVKEGDNQIVVDRWGGKVAIPAFTLITDGRGSGGMLQRQCTGNWKIAPIRRFIQSKRAGDRVEMLIGISTDEWQRMRDSDVKYITNVYPLIDKRMSRFDCMTWLQTQGLEIPSKSACYFCPFRTTKEWKEVKGSTDWDKVIDVDNLIRDARPGDRGIRNYLHASRKPIAQVDFRTAEEKGQMTLWDNECSGICGV